MSNRKISPPAAFALAEGDDTVTGREMITALVAAYEIARGAHRGQLRRSGEPYITHPLAVAGIVAQYGMDDVSIAAALLHDAVEDTVLTLDEIEAAIPEALGHIFAAKPHLIFYAQAEMLLEEDEGCPVYDDYGSVESDLH